MFFRKMAIILCGMETSSFTLNVKNVSFYEFLVSEHRLFSTFKLQVKIHGHSFTVCLYIKLNVSN